MAIEQFLIAWRVHRGFSQAELAEAAGLTRAYVSRVESGRADPSLSVLMKLASALKVSVGTLLEELPKTPEPTSDELDTLARGVYHPGQAGVRNHPHIRTLARLFQDRRAALGLYRPRKGSCSRSQRQGAGHQSVRKLRAALGEKTWAALLRRIDKHAAFQGGRL